MATKNKKSKAKLKAVKTAKPKSKKTENKKTAKAKSAKPKTAAKKSASSKPAGKVISMAAARENRQSQIDWKNFFTPVDNRVLLEVTKPAEKTAGGLFIPDSAQSKSNHARVLAVGPGKRNKKGRRCPLDVQVGEKVLYAEYAGSKLELGGRDLLLVSENDILGVLDT